MTGLALAGCASGNINPTSARANTGYVDVHANTPAELSWEVARFDPAAGEFRRMVSDYDPSADGILRLELAPGPHRLRLTCLNRVTSGPAEIELEVANGKITPICVSFAGAGTAMVETKKASVGGTVYGRYGRRTKIRDNEEAMYQISATASEPVPYRVKGEMPYAR